MELAILLLHLDNSYVHLVVIILWSSRVTVIFVFMEQMVFVNGTVELKKEVKMQQMEVELFFNMMVTLLYIMVEVLMYGLRKLSLINQSE